MSKKSFPMMTLLGLCCLWIGLGLSAPVPKPPRVDHEKVLEELFGTTWMPERTIVEGKKSKGINYSARYSKEAVYIGEFEEVCPGGVIIDTTHTPWRFDMTNRDINSTAVTPGIFKFEDGKLVTCFGNKWYDKIDPKGDYPTRPTQFGSTKENGCILTTCKRWPNY